MDWPLCSLEQIEALVDDFETSGVDNWESKLSVWDIKHKNWVSISNPSPKEQIVTYLSSYFDRFV